MRLKLAAYSGLPQSDWLFEPFVAVSFRCTRAGDSNSSAVERFPSKTARFEEWLAMEVKAWPEASGLDLASQWLIREMTAQSE